MNCRDVLRPEDNKGERTPRVEEAERKVKDCKNWWSHETTDE